MKNFTAVTAALCAVALFSCGVEEGALETTETIAVSKQALTGPMPYRGVNLAGAEFGIASDGTGQNPGTHGGAYIYPDPSYASGYSANYFLQKGMTTFRLPFRWERLQRTRRAAFDAAELTRLRTTVNRLTSQGAVVLLDPHNYARYGTAYIGSASVPNADFADFWSRLATEFKGNPNVLFGLMNEPYGLPTEQWVGSANAAIAAIRATGATNLILVPGNAWSGAHSWTQNWYGTANSVAMLAIRDPGNNYAFEVHQYFDSGYSGATTTCLSATTGADQMRSLTAWLRANGKKAFLGEFATGTSATCLTALDGLLTYMEQNADVYLGWTWWAAGPWWGSSWTSLEPTSTGADKPQMDVLERHLAAVTPPASSCTDGVRNGTETGVDCGGSCAACAPVASCTDGVRNGTETGVDCGGSCAACAPVASCTDGVRNGAETGVDCGGSCAACTTGGTCQARTWEAETMTRSTGGSVTGGWNLWTNGNVQTTSSVTFPATSSTLAVTARGTSAGGVWPRMIVSVGSTTLGTVNVTSTSWAAYRFTVPANASGLVRVAFDNDAVSGSEDRNLYVDKVVLECGATTTPPPAPAPTCTGATYEAESMTKTTGGAVTGGWNLWSNGSVSTQHPFVAAPVRVAVVARGQSAGGVWPRMIVSVGGQVLSTVSVTSTSWTEYGVDLTRAAGSAEIRVSFDNDAIVGSEDRNLLLDKVIVRCR
jgi:endoglucanase